MVRSSVPAKGASLQAMRKLTDAQVQEMRTRAAAGEAFTSLGRAFGLNHSAVQAAVRGFTYKDAGGPTGHPPRPRGYRSSLTPETRARAVEMLAAGASARSVSRELGVSLWSTCRIAKEGR